jgi:ankyrin repeat protein
MVTSTEFRFLQAANEGKIRIVERLLSLRKMNVNCYDYINHDTSHKYTALHFAARNGHLDVMNFLLNNGAEIDFRTGKNIMTPLFFAIYFGQYDAVSLLLEKGADVNISKGGMATPLTAALKNKYFRIAKLLIEKGAITFFDIDFFDSPLHWACRHGNNELTKLLLQKGSNIFLHGDVLDRQTPLSIARNLGHFEIVNLIEDHLMEKN